MERRYSEKDKSFWQRTVLPEEDRLAHTEWKGVGCRWFKSENVVCLEHYLRAAETNQAPRQKAS
jgi:hypothetical protein